LPWAKTNEVEGAKRRKRKRGIYSGSRENRVNPPSHPKISLENELGNIIDIIERRGMWVVVRYTTVINSRARVA
jgi:hypothetical protein